jgi:hypothetical protein
MRTQVRRLDPMLLTCAVLSATLTVGIVTESWPVRLLCGSVFILLGLLLDLFSLHTLSRGRGSCDLITPALLYAIGLYILSRVMTNYHLLLAGCMTALTHVSCQYAIPHLTWYLWNTNNTSYEESGRNSIDNSTQHCDSDIQAKEQP